MSKPLFRQEAIDAQREKFLGETSAAQPLPLWILTALFVAIAVLLVVIGIWGEYTRRERVSGFLASEAGAAQLRIPDSGVISELLVGEGDEVPAGAIIARVAVDRSGSGIFSSGAVVVQELQERQSFLVQELDQTRRLGQRQVEQARQRVEDLQREIAATDAEIKLQQNRLATTQAIARRFSELGQDKYISPIAVREKENEATDQAILLQKLQRERAALEKELATVRLDIPSIELKTRTQIEQLKRQASELQQQTAEENVRHETVIRAPFAGTLTNISLHRGQAVAASTPLATLLPAGSGLRAELLVPTRAIGFVQPGQEVMLRYEAFPYERFGQYRGWVDKVGKTVWSQGDTVGQAVADEPVYRITVRLEHQNVHANGQAFALRPGMVVSADLLMEKRTLLEWLFQPVLQLKERLQ